jgi:N-acetylmuramoyl-L-alanine amidase
MIIRTVAACCLAGIMAMLAVSVDAATIKGVRLWRAPDNTRLVFDLSGPVEHKLLDNPGEKGRAQRIVITVPDTEPPAGNVDVSNTPIASFRTETSGKELRVLVDLDKRVKAKSFLLPANEQYGHRLVVDLFDEVEQEEKRIARPAGNGLRDIVIAVDAGHGGEGRMRRINLLHH